MLRRIAILLAVIAALSWIGYRFLPGAARGTEPYGSVDPIRLAAIMALVAAVAALVLAWRAHVDARSARTDFRRLALSVDTMMTELSARHDREAASVAELNDLVSREIRALSRTVERRGEKPEPGMPPAVPAEMPSVEAANVVAHPASFRKAAASERSPAAAEALERAVAANALEMSLQPIISVSQGAAVAFEAFAHVELGDGRALDVARLAEPSPTFRHASFERALINGAAEASRRQLGVSGERMPFHVPVSSNLLKDPEELDAVVRLFDLHPVLCRSLILSLAGTELDTARDIEDGMERLTASGVRFALEGWHDLLAGRHDASRLGAAMLKLPAGRLLGRESADISVEDVLRQAAKNDIGIIATDVSNDEDAVTIIDLGIDLLSGSRFSGPKRLKPVPKGNPVGKRVGDRD